MTAQTEEAAQLGVRLHTLNEELSQAQRAMLDAGSKEEKQKRSERCNELDAMIQAEHGQFRSMSPPVQRPVTTMPAADDNTDKDVNPSALNQVSQLNQVALLVCCDTGVYFLFAVSFYPVLFGAAVLSVFCFSLYSILLPGHAFLAVSLCVFLLSSSLYPAALSLSVVRSLSMLLPSMLSSLALSISSPAVSSRGILSIRSLHHRPSTPLKSS